MLHPEDEKLLSPNSSTVRVVLRWVGFAAIVLAVVAFIGYLLNWFTVPLEVTSPEKLQEMSREANDAYEALESQKATIAGLQQSANDYIVLYGEDYGTWPQGKKDEYQQVLQQIRNLITSYNQACGEYEAMWKDEWRAFSAPKDLPTTCELIQ